MGQFFTDDIDSLLKSGHGDVSRLNKIKSEFIATKLVSIDDRKYVEGLISRYLQTTPASKPEKTIKDSEKRIVPPPPAPRNPPTLLEVKQKPKKEQTIAKIDKKPKTRSIIIGICAVAIAVLAIAAVTMNQDQGIGVISTPKNLETDTASYVRGDVISISGKVSDASQTVRLAISNPSNVEIWSETVTVKQSKEFSTLVIAGGDGWDQAGKFTLSSTHSGTTDTTSFDFNPNQSS